MSDNSNSNMFEKEWSLIESDPGVFYELVEEMGCKGIDFEEILMMEDEHLQELNKLKKVYGYIFLFKFSPEEYKKSQASQDSQLVEEIPPLLICPKQVATNSCATVAILSILLNQKDLDLGPSLEELRSFCQELPPAEQGIAISQLDFIVNAHNHFKASSSFEFIPSSTSPKQDAFHYVSYIPFDGKVYELDGLRAAPICLGEYEDENWSSQVLKRVQSRIEGLQPEDKNFSEIRFNLMALTEKTLPTIQKAILIKRIEILRIAFKLLSLGEDTEDLIGDMYKHNVSGSEDLDNFDVSTVEESNENVDELEKTLSVLKEDLKNLEMRAENDVNEKIKWKKENVFRRHDFVPFVLCALRHLARMKELRMYYIMATNSLYPRDFPRA